MPDFSEKGRCDFQPPRQGSVIFQAQPVDQRVQQVVGSYEVGKARDVNFMDKNEVHRRDANRISREIAIWECVDNP